MSGVGGFDHVSLPLADAPAMTAFYRALGLQVVETSYLVQVYAGTQMINFHQPSIWQQEGFTLRAPAATPPCGDLCFVWEGSSTALVSVLEGAGAAIVEGPVARDGGRQQPGVSVYVRDPDGNLLEFIRYPDASDASDASDREGAARAG